ncbi:MAG: FG-GAP repeat domain-containing protein, partial [Actinomycetota bacterium]
VQGGETYQVLHPDGTTATATGSKLMEGCETNPGTSSVEIRGLRGDAPQPSLAVSGVAVPRPRPTTVLNPGSAVYREAATALLGERGIDDADADVVQVLRADLDGDGKDEVVVVAERIADRDLFAREGDYSVVFVRRLEDERPVPSVVVESIPRTRPGETPFIVSHRVTAIADLNGDGRMEVAVYGRYYEGAGIEVHELQPDGSLPVVMEGGCGA